jgi:hypothetical protein
MGQVWAGVYASIFSDLQLFQLTGQQEMRLVSIPAGKASPEEKIGRR